METTKLAAADRPRERYRYKVTGTGFFPIDMLRYDCAYPASSEACLAISPASADRDKRRTVELLSYRLPTPDRWRSFGWLVED